MAATTTTTRATAPTMLPQQPQMAYVPHTGSNRLFAAKPMIPPHASSPHSHNHHHHHQHHQHKQHGRIDSTSSVSPVCSSISTDKHAWHSSSGSESSSISSVSSSPARVSCQLPIQSRPDKGQPHAHRISQSHARHSGVSSPNPHRSSGSRKNVDLEQGLRIPQRQQGRSQSSHARSTPVPVSSYHIAEQDFDEISPELEAKALRICLFMSLVNPFITLVVAFYTLFAMVASLLLQPLRLCTSSVSLGQQLTSFLSPALKVELAFIYSLAGDCEEFSAAALLAVMLLSPLISFGVAGASWVAAAFWFFNAILGDPDGKDGHNDGRASVLAVRSWWEGWLARPIRY